MAQSLKQIRLVILLIAPAFLGLAVVGSYLIARAALRPVDRIADTAVEIEAGDLSKRITGIESRDEVGRLAGAFNGMLERLEVSFRREKQFTSDASHELRTPVSIVMAYGEDLARSADPGVKKQAEAILTESRRMNAIIAQLLALTRGYEGKYKLEPEEIVLEEMVADILDELRDNAAERSITLTSGVLPGTVLTADQSLMTQLFLNLVENGIKYGRPGGTVDVSARSEEGHTVLTVEDDGIGIDPEDLPHIFDRFYRADRARDRTGSGLGLSRIGFRHIIVVDDGSCQETQQYFEALPAGCAVLHLPKNGGKGGALKMGFLYFICHQWDDLGVVTVDGDGQHSPEDALRCAPTRWRPGPTRSSWAGGTSPGRTCRSAAGGATRP